MSAVRAGPALAEMGGAPVAVLLPVDGQVASIAPIASHSRAVAVSSHLTFTVTQLVAYSHQNSVRGGRQPSGPCEPFERFADAVTAKRCSGWARSFAYARRFSTSHF